MLSDDKDSYAALQSLLDDNNKKPIIFWLGAGVSMWASFPLWQALASSMHTKFSRSTPSYNKKQGLEKLEKLDFPAVFELMKQENSQLYFAELADTFKSHQTTPVYSRMLRSLEKMRPSKPRSS